MIDPVDREPMPTKVSPRRRREKPRTVRRTSKRGVREASREELEKLADKFVLVHGAFLSAGPLPALLADWLDLVAERMNERAALHLMISDVQVDAPKRVLRVEYAMRDDWHRPRIVLGRARLNMEHTKAGDAADVAADALFSVPIPKALRKQEWLWRDTVERLTQRWDALRAEAPTIALALVGFAAIVSGHADLIRPSPLSPAVQERRKRQGTKRAGRPVVPSADWLSEKITMADQQGVRVNVAALGRLLAGRYACLPELTEEEWCAFWQTKVQDDLEGYARRKERAPE